MRIIGNIDHPNMKITVFKMDNKLSIKFELGLYEQTFKFRESEYMKNMGDAEKFIDATFLGEVLKNFNQMHKSKNEALALLVKLEEEGEFPVII
ncbi:MAG: hypothetical protein AAFZ15_25905 [Bacteroidota bacterium]